jgi:hypothetical protein
MFLYCSGAVFTMNSGFNLPQNITTAGDYFASNMFDTCYGDAFTMNDVFNLPQNISSAGDYFAYGMFASGGGDAFLVNGVFTFPASGSFRPGAFYGTFSLAGNAPQTRTATSIINGRGAPASDMNTFGPSTAWSDYSTIDVNWQGQ